MIVKPLPLYIGLRYTRAKRRNRFISFISIASIIGIALGITVLITVLSVINGFDEKIRDRFFSLAPQVTVLTKKDLTQVWPELSGKLLQVPHVQGVAPFVTGQGMLLNEASLRGINIIGILPTQETHISALAQQVIAGNLTSLQPGSNNLLIGKALAKQLDLTIGDSVNIFIAQDGAIDELPQFDYHQFNVTAIFSSSEGFGFDRVLVYADMTDAQNLLAHTQHLNGLHLKLDDLYQAGQVSQNVQGLLGRGYTVSNWSEQFGSFFQTLAMQKTMLFVILLFIIAIASFNLISTLIMVVNEKQADIAILRTLGATPAMIMSAFIVQGSLIGLAGTLIGLIGGILLAMNVTGLVDAIQRIFHIQLIAESVYFVNYLPSKIIYLDLVKVCGIAFGLSILATIYPALRAFRTQPAQVLRYE